MKICCDYDSVLVDFTTPWLKWVNRLYHTNVNTWMMKDFDYLEHLLGSHANEFWKTKGFYNHVRPIPEAPNFLSELQKTYGKENVFIVTSSLPVTQPEKHEHIHKHFSIADENVIHARVKHPHTKDGILIDDHLKNCINHSLNNNAPSIVFDYKGSYGWSKYSNYKDVETLEKVFPLLNKCRTFESVLKKLNHCLHKDTFPVQLEQK